MSVWFAGKNDRNKLENTNAKYFRFDKSLKYFYSHQFRLTNKTTVYGRVRILCIHEKWRTINDDYTFHKERFPP